MLSVAKYGTVLQAASSEGLEEIVKLLIEKGSDLNFQGKCILLLSETDAESVS